LNKIYKTLNKKDMIAIHPQYIKDTAGKNLVILSQKEFDTLMEELEELEDIKLYDEAKKEDTGERILFSDYLKNRKNKNA
jgi:PHD/YefM family antitoxin component YafN of YafNO toxin-antitoxin module